MDGFTYTNIFETKGIEYLVIIGFLTILIPFWIIINKKINVRDQIRNTIAVLTANILRIPQGLFYSKSHTWAYLEKSGNAKIGFDDFLVKVVGNVEITNLKAPGEELKKGEILAEILQQGKRLRIISPITGEIMQINETVIENPALLNEDPYDQGWIYSVIPSNWKVETKSYFLASEATQWISRELTRFKDFLAVSIGRHASESSMIAFQEGGELRMNPMTEMQSEIWQDFEKEFLSKNDIA